MTDSTVKTLILPCNKGCGHNIEVGEEQIKEARDAGVPLTVQHEVCPTDKFGEDTEYNVRIEVWRTRTVTDDTEWEELNKSNDSNTITFTDADDTDELSIDSEPMGTRRVKELLTTVGDTIAARDFTSAAVPLGQKMSEQWGRVVNMGDVIDG